jgi:NitT/TauT family transport system permease protein
MNFTRNSAKWFPPIITSLILFAVMEFLVRTEVLNPSLFPSPLQILASLDENKTEFLTALMQTTLAVVAGFSLSIVFGLTLAILFSLNSFLRRGVLPFAIFFQTVPIIAIAPLLVIYFGFGISTVIAAAMIVSIFPIIANALVGLSSAPRDQADLFKIYKASAVKTLLPFIQALRSLQDLQ